MTFLRSQAVLLLSLVVGLTRLPAVAESLLDWDEAQFVWAVREYDVSIHHPHPPGYPLFIAAAKAFRFAGLEEFRALQAVVLVGAMLLFPAAYFLARQLRFDVGISIAGAMILAFVPNVWIYGGTGFSDIPALTLGLAACACLWRGHDSSPAFLVGGLALGCAVGFRPASVLLAAVPAVGGALGRWRAGAYGAIAGSLLLAGAVGGGSYYGAALASASVDDYRSAVETQSTWIRETDSFQNPHRPPVLQAASVFLLHPFEQDQQLTALVALALVSIAAAAVSRRRAPLMVLLTFAPMMALSVLTLDIATPGRYAIAYMPAYALLAADGLGVILRRTGLAVGVAAAGALAMAVWTWPAVQMQHTTAAPAVQALRWASAQTPRSAPLYVSDAFRPHAGAVLPNRRVQVYTDVHRINPLHADAHMVDWLPRPASTTFSRAHDRLWRVVRRRGFEAYVTRLSDFIHFREGWYDADRPGGLDTWMAKSGVIALPPLPGKARLTLGLLAPSDLLGPRPTVRIFINGVLLHEVRPQTDAFGGTWMVEVPQGRASELRITTTRTAVPADVWSDSTDTRELGVMLTQFAWAPVDPSGRR